MGSRALAVALMGALLAAPAVARADDTVRVTGRVFRGTLVEVRKPVFLRLRLADDSEVLVPWADVRSVEHTGPSLPLAPELAPPPAALTHWYGWQTLAVDGAAVLLLGVEAIPVSLPLYLAGGPTIHAMHGSPTRVLGSALLRVLMPITMAGVGAYLADVGSRPGNGEDTGLSPAFTGLLVGGALGIVGASVLDATVLAREPVARVTPADSHASSALRLAPLVSLRNGGEGVRAGWIGVMGAF